MKDELAALPAEPLTLLWSSQWNDKWSGSGLEHVVIRPGTADGVIVGLDEAKRPYRVQYHINWDERWHTRDVAINIVSLSMAHNFYLTADENGNWFEGNRDLIPDLAGCLDIDIWPTPFTNTLAIRRLNLEPGKRAEIDVVYVDALAGELVKARQAYSRVGKDRTFMFETLSNGFNAEIKVDEFGFVLEYPGLFSRVRLD